MRVRFGSPIPLDCDFWPGETVVPVFPGAFFVVLRGEGAGGGSLPLGIWRGDGEGAFLGIFALLSGLRVR